MTYNPVPTQTVDDNWTADEHNTYIRDNFAAGVPDIFTTKGDLAVATGADAAARLGVGADGTVLTADSGEETGLKYATIGTNPLYARYKVAAVTSLTNDTDVIVNFGTEEFDTENAVTVGASWKLTVPVGFAGYYLIPALVTLESAAFDAGEYLQISVYVGETLKTIIAKRVVDTAGTFVLSVGGSVIVYLADEDEVSIKAKQNSGAAVNVAADGDSNHVSIVRVI